MQPQACPAHVQYIRGAPPRFGYPARPLEAKKVVTQIPVAGGRVPLCPQPVAAVTAVLAAPTPNNCKIQPQLQNLPRFQPPDFEGEDGQLPRPDSPCSTPRAGDTSHGNLQDAGPFSPSAFVEYRSRSSGQWILAKVESFCAETQTYRLDVQPYAPADRVRAPRRPLPKKLEVSGGPATPAEEAQPVSTAGYERDATPRRGLESLQADAVHEAKPKTPVCEAGPLELSLQDEVEMLRRRVSELEEQNRTLYSQVVHEAELKERYRQELADLRNRGHTPR
mmetsp:Transcript_58296/g.130185  ORF Transcript_58296/g.130185 Transcript_58296/m.130185 type:complete len:279 (+) Transcript_58296:56-892(+)